MKKTVLFIIVAVITACNNPDKTVRKAHFRAAMVVNTDTLITLNGIGKSTAEAMIAHFDSCKGRDTRPTRQSVWFDSATIHRMVRLLDKEIVEQRAARNPQEPDTLMGVADGIRIYYISDLRVKTGRLVNSVALISTQHNGHDCQVTSCAKHKDYYNHAKNDDLFKDTIAIRGRVSKKPAVIVANGEITYNICVRNCNVPSCDPRSIHYITRRQAHMMLNQFRGRSITTKSEWFDLNLFRDFVNDKTVDGLRIYFARHPIERDTTTSGKDAFILVPTRSATFLGKQIHEDYLNCETTNNFFKNFTRKNQFRRGSRDLRPVGGGQDNGELCPSNCDQGASTKPRIKQNQGLC
ncbi:hypothetical protein [Mucilaginibacter sp. UR6-11]|uniref:hypothetical protein n=1 Tax=Mucilaginibacter sp. UR6-11 TaxID=1435644 RepID=UPI001E48607C|nr:hypothetical protein [Mucilaginibacter sp. UR6-11]MCC8424457.1 hypothetical protein [Mucilaginibacter sp. UR6-11]